MLSTQLEQLCTLSQDSLKAPLLYLEKGSSATARFFAKQASAPWVDEAAAEQLLVKLTGQEHAKLKQEILNAWKPYRGMGDSDNYLYQTLFGDRCPAFDDRGQVRSDFVANSLNIWAPIVRARNVRPKVPKPKAKGKAK